jgi:adenylate cyclase
MVPTQSSASTSATVAFVDLAGFSAIADVYGDESAIAVLEIFESMVSEALSGYEPPIKWIGDEAMLSFPEPDIAIQALGTLLQACRKEPRLPLTRAGLNHGPVIRRASDLFGSTVNIAARIASLTSPGQLLATQPIAEAAAAKGILVRDLGKVALRSLLAKSLFMRSNSLRHPIQLGSIPSVRCLLRMHPIDGLCQKGRGFVRRVAKMHIGSRLRPIRCLDDRLAAMVALRLG